MKVLVVHNFYRSSSPSGEDIVVRNEIALLRDHGVDVVTYERHNDSIGDGWDRFRTACSTVWSPRVYRDVRDLLLRERPDVAHFHNLWYLVSPSGYEACHDLGVPVVQTLHNYRLFCANGLLMRNGQICEDCVGRLPWRGLARGCYQSRLRSVPVVAAESFHQLRGTWARRVDAFVALSAFARDKFIECGIPRDRLVVKPNFFSGEVPAPIVDSGYGLFLGRLSEEKGVQTILDAARLVDVPMLIVGDGPLRNQLQSRALSLGLRNITFLGGKSHEEGMMLLAGASFLLLPSLCYENFPMALVEAFACAKPVIASRVGALAEAVRDGETGLLFLPGRAEDLASKVHWLASHPGAAREIGRRGNAAFAELYCPESNIRILLEVYERARRRQR